MSCIFPKRRADRAKAEYWAAPDRNLRRNAHEKQEAADQRHIADGAVDPGSPLRALMIPEIVEHRRGDEKKENEARGRKCGPDTSDQQRAGRDLQGYAEPEHRSRLWHAARRHQLRHQGRVQNIANAGKHEGAAQQQAAGENELC
jgi:hypothetical protein